MTVQRLRLGDILELQRKPIVLGADQQYIRLGIYSWGRGTLHRDSVPHHEMGRLRYFSIPAHALLVSNIQAWEGALAVTTDADASCVASNRFLSYLPRNGSGLDVNFVLQYLLSDAGFEQVQRASPGTQVRNRTLSIKSFENITIPIVDIEAQHKAVAQFQAIAELAASFIARAPKATARSLLPTMTQQALTCYGAGLTVLSDLVDQISDIVHPGNDIGNATHFVGLEHIESHTGERVARRLVHEERGRKQRFRPGDIVFGYLRPYLNKVWLADQHGLCSVEQFVLRPRPGIDGEMLAFSLRAAGVHGEAIRLTNSLQLPRLSSRQLLNLQVQYVNPPAQDLKRRLSRLVRSARELDLLATRRKSLSEALLPAARNEVFSRYP